MFSNASKLFAVIFTLASFSVGIVRAEDTIRAEREAAKSWGLHRIAILQAQAGDFQDAKRTISQIDETGAPGSSDVTAVWFNNGEIVYDHLPASIVLDRISQPELPRLIRVKQIPASVPAEVPAGLPADYLAPDPQHGDLLAFTDECDSRGTRVTSRTYADGLTVIETPQADKRVF